MNHSDERAEAAQEPPPGSSEARPSGRLQVLVALTAITVLALDQFTKHLAMTRLTLNEPVTVINGWLQWRLIRNPYAAFSLSPGSTWILTLIALAVIVVIVLWVRRVGQPWWALAMGLLLGGALGNLTDRLLRDPGFARGHVVDFIEFLRFPGMDFPVFNVADSAITVSAVLIAVLAVRNVPFEGPSALPATAPENGAAHD